MAIFERTQFSPIGEAVREWRWGRFAPLYAAGILAGLGAGFALATWPSEAPAVREHTAFESRAGTLDVASLAPVLVLPEAPAVQPNAATTTELPLEWYPAMMVAAAEPAVEPAVEPIAPVADAPAPAPAALAPAGAQPVAQAPVVKPAPVAPPAPAAAAAPPAKPNFYVPAVSAGPATGSELALLSLINAERANAGLAPYRLEAGLTKVARTRSQQLIDQNYFAHRDPYGYSMYVELLAHFGYGSYAWAGENLAMNNWPIDTAAAEAMTGLMNSPTHRANILAGDFSRIGIGEVTAGDGRHFFTMIFLG